MAKMETSTARARSRLYRIATKQAVKKIGFVGVLGLANLLCMTMMSQSDPPMNLYY